MKPLTSSALIAFASSASAQVTPIPESFFSNNATIETFEGVLGVLIPQSTIGGETQAVGDIPGGFVFPSTGVSIAEGNALTLVDYSVPNMLGGGWGLGPPCFDLLLEGSPIPSGTAFIGDFAAPLDFTLPEPVFRIGAWVEAAGCGEAQLRVFDDNGALIGSVSTSTDGDVNGLSTFIGLQSTSFPISRAVFLTSGGALDDLTMECFLVFASETIRVGTPPNPSAFLPGQTSGPSLGSTWDPVIDHGTFFPSAILDIAIATLSEPINTPTPVGTLLCDLPTSPSLIFSAPAGTPFAIPIPTDCAASGQTVCTQGASIDGSGIVELTNAIDLLVGF